MSPFEIFRRNLKPMMILLTGLALFAFVVLPVIDTYMRQNSGGGGDAVAASFKGNEISRNRVEYFTRNHNSTINFLNDLAMETVARGGVPRTAGFQMNPQTKQVQSLGINPNPSAVGTIRTFMLADEAREAGFDLDDSSLDVWMEQFTDGMLTRSEVDAMLMQATQNQMARPHLYEQLRSHLLASVYEQRGYATVLAGNRMPLLTPAEQWSNFLKLNQKARATTYGVMVNDFLEKTSKTPTEAEVIAMYEEGKDRDSNDQSAEPAFHRRYAAKFEYLVGSYQSFLDEEVAKLTEEQIRAEYERRLNGGDFQLPVDPPMVDAAGEDTAETTESTEPDAKPDDKPEPENADKAKPETEEPEADADAATETETEPATEEEPVESEETEPASEDQSNNLESTAVRLVAFQQEDAEQKEEEAASEEPAESEDEPQDDEKEEPKSEDEPASEEEPKPEAEPKTDDAPQDEPASDDKTETEDTPQDEPKDEPKSDAPADEPAEEEKPKVETFEDVRDQIAEDMAGPAARARMDAAVTEIAKEMQLYGNKLAIHESNVSIGQGGEPPALPDLKAMAEKHGFTFESIGPYDSVTIADEPIAESFEVGSQFGRRGPGFSVMMFGFNNGRNQLPPQQLFSPLRTADDPAGKIYVSWKIAETEAYTPTLDEVRDEVVMAIRMKEARELAKAHADELAKQAAASDKPLKDLIPEDKQDNLKSDLGPFSWMDSFGFQGASIGNVPQLDSVGSEFMKAVFTTDLNEYAAALNEPGRVVYVVQPTEFTPSVDELRQQFKQPTNRMMATFVGNDAGAIINGFYEAIDEQTGYKSFLESE